MLLRPLYHIYDIYTTHYKEKPPEILDIAGFSGGLNGVELQKSGKSCRK